MIVAPRYLTPKLDKIPSYMSMIFAISIFIGLDLAILTLNYAVSLAVDRATEEVNIAGRQRMLSQQLTKAVVLQEMAVRDRYMDGKRSQEALVAKDVAEVGYSSQSAHIYHDHSQEIRESFALFDSTLNGFIRGGEGESTLSEDIVLRPLTKAKSTDILNKTNELWLPIASLVSGLLESDGLNDADKLGSLRKILLENNQKILILMNELTWEIEARSKSETRSLRYFQAFALLLAVINFAIIVNQFFSHLKVSGGVRTFLTSIVEKLSVAVIIADANGEVISSNAESTTLFGYSGDGLCGKKIDDLFVDNGNDRFGVRQDGTAFYADKKSKLLELEAEQLSIVTICDITAQKETEALLSGLAFRDSLTGLANRVRFNENLDEEIARAKRNSEIFALCIIDLDGFKKVNDTYGHSIGDALLIEVGRRLLFCAREVDSVARIGGDEFAIIFSGVKSRENINRLTSRVIRQVNEIKEIEGRSVAVGASVGVSVYPYQSELKEGLIDLADKAMYRAKRSGKNQFTVCEKNVYRLITEPSC